MMSEEDNKIMNVDTLAVNVELSTEDLKKVAMLEGIVDVLTENGFVSNEHEDVRKFHQKFGLLEHEVPGHLTKRKLKERIECMLEELTEFASACGLDIVPSYVADRKPVGNFIVIDTQTDQDLAGQADALIDLVYFAKGTSVMLGLPWSRLWDDVQRANMEKVRGVGKRGHAVDCVKPMGWVPPDPDGILREAGYDRGEYEQYDESTIHEPYCRDDSQDDESTETPLTGGWLDD